MLALWKKFQQFYGRQFAPKIYEVLKTGYDAEKFRRDCISGITVAVMRDLVHALSDTEPLSVFVGYRRVEIDAYGLYAASARRQGLKAIA